MLKKIMLVVLVALFATGCCKKDGADNAEKKEAPKAEQKAAGKKAEEPAAGLEDFVGKTEIDPVCKMKVAVKEDTPHSHLDGKHYFFCNPGCKEAFDKAPKSFLNK